METITQAKPDDVEEIQAFYRRCVYGGGLSKQDLVLIVRSEAKIIGAVRLCPETDFFVLRGMQVLESFQGQGIGRKLLKASTETVAGRVCYCIPWQHLKSFYEQAGFQEISSHQAPALLCERLNNYISREMSVILMCRYPAS